MPATRDAMSAERREPLAEDRLSLKWKFVTVGSLDGDRAAGVRGAGDLGRHAVRRLGRRTVLRAALVDRRGPLEEAARLGRVRAARRSRLSLRRHERRLPRRARLADRRREVALSGPRPDRADADVDRRSDRVRERGRSGDRARLADRQVQVAVQVGDSRGVHAARPLRRAARRRPPVRRVLERHAGRAPQGHRLGRVVDLAQGRRGSIHGRRRDADRARRRCSTRRRRRAASTRSTR